MSSFSSLNLGARAIFAAQRGLDITGQNISNTATPGYSRQRVDQVAVGGPTVPAIWAKYDQTGGGVKVTGISRIRDEFLEARARTAHSALGQIDEQQKVYANVEKVFNEPSSTGLKAQLADFWNAWSKISNDPRAEAPRNVVVERGKVVANRLNDMSSQLQTQWADGRSELGANITDVNTAVETIAKLNRAIRNNVINGLPANELADQRDLLVEKVTSLTGGTAVRAADGVVNVELGGKMLVDGPFHATLAVSSTTATYKDFVVPGPKDPIAIVWATKLDGTDEDIPLPIALDSATAANPKSTLNGQLESLNTTLPSYLDSLDSIATQLGDMVNTQQVGNYTTAGVYATDDTTLPLFSNHTGTLAAASITFSGGPADLAISHGNPIATAPDVPALDGNNAKDMSIHLTDATGPDASFRTMITTLGVAAGSVNAQQAVAKNVASTADDARESVSGVSLNEEMTNLMQYQHSFEAAAKFINAIDSTIETLINMTR